MIQGAILILDAMKSNTRNSVDKKKSRFNNVLSEL
jgi:hypothetical protein